MVNAVIEALVFAAALCGALALTYVLALRFVARGAAREVLILFDAGDRNCARRLYAAQLRLSFFCLPGSCRVLGVDCGVQEDESKACRALCRQCSNMDWLTREELYRILMKGDRMDEHERS